MYIWFGPSNGPSCWMFWDSPVTWKDAPESGIQIVELGSWFLELTSIALGWESVRSSSLILFWTKGVWWIALKLWFHQSERHIWLKIRILTKMTQSYCGTKFEANMTLKICITTTAFAATTMTSTTIKVITSTTVATAAIRIIASITVAIATIEATMISRIIGLILWIEIIWRWIVRICRWV